MQHEGGIGDEPVEEKYRAWLQAIARTMDEFLNGEERPKKTGFVIMMFPFDDPAGRCNYMSNAQREDVVTMLKEQLAHFEGRSLPGSRA